MRAKTRQQVEVWRCLGKDSRAAWGLESQLMVALQKIDMRG